MSNMKEIFKHHEDIGRRYKNLSYEDTHAIHKIFIDGDKEIKKLRDTLDRVGLLAKNLETDTEASFLDALMVCNEICQMAIEALKESE